MLRFWVKQYALERWNKNSHEMINDDEIREKVNGHPNSLFPSCLYLKTGTTTV
jgi:hypothetical protein